MTYAVESVHESLPDLNIASPLAFVVKAIDSVYLCALVITSEQEEVLRVLDFIAEHHTYGFNRLFASINIVS